MHTYTPRFFAGLVALCILGFVLAAVASAFPPAITRVLNALAGALLVVDSILVAVADWEGYSTLNGRIPWRSMPKNKRFWLVCLFWIFCPVPLVVYLVQVARYKPAPPPAVPQEGQ
jgi:hypothetical protein